VKKFRFISSLLLVILTLYPSIVGAMGSCDEETLCCESTTSDEKESEHDCMDLCLCSCCGTSIFFDMENEKKADSIHSISSHIVLFTYQSQFSSIFFVDIWQPPRQS